MPGFLLQLHIAEGRRRPVAPTSAMTATLFQYECKELIPANIFRVNVGRGGINQELRVNTFR